METNKKQVLKKYRVGFWYTTYGTTEIEAETPEKAEEILDDILCMNGFTDLVHEVNDRDYGAQDAEEVKQEGTE